MRVQELMSTHVQACDANADLAKVAKMMWDGDCGIVPVTDGNRNVIGVVTDRDICIAAATRATAPAAIRARDVMSQEVFTCDQRDDVRQVLATLKDRRVRRLPVVDAEARLVGIISLNDLVRAADCRRTSAIPGEDFLDTMKAISAHVTPALQ